MNTRTLLMSMLLLLSTPAVAAPEKKGVEAGTAAQIAGSCMHWPKETFHSLETMHTGMHMKYPATLSPTIKQIAVISNTGDCIWHDDVVVSAETVMKELPDYASAMIRNGGDSDGLYLLLLQSSGQDGTRVFVGFRIGEGVENPSPGDEQGESGVDDDTPQVDDVNPDGSAMRPHYSVAI